MKPGLIRVTACSLSLMLLPASGYLAAASAQAPAAIAQAPTYAPQQLDQIIAPVALYPDPLLAQIMMASTYPLEIVEAARWVQDRNNAQLRGDQLNAALEQQDWDPSVKSLVPFPQILQMMNSRLDWTQSLGNAFLAQQGDVMDSVQRLRAQAQAAGTLQSTPQETVSTNGQVITIEPANPQLVYVPYYNPRVVYGRWDYPDYPPIYFPPPPNYGYVAGPGIYFGIGFGIVGALWGWDQWDWGHHDISVNADRYNSINSYEIAHDNRPRYSASTWQHDPGHRRGVPYSNPAVRQQFQPAAAGAADTRRGFRGFDSGAGAPVAAPTTTGRAAQGQRGAPAATVATAPAATGRAPHGQRGAPVAGAPQTPPAAANAAAAPGATPNSVPRSAQTARPERGQAAAPAVATPHTSPRTAMAPPHGHAPAAFGGAPPRPATQHQAPPAFAPAGRAAEIQAQSQRGQASRQAIAHAPPPHVAAAPAPHAPPPAAHAAAPAPHAPPPQKVSAGSSQKGAADDKQHH